MSIEADGRAHLAAPHRAHLDGLRAFAVYLVVIYHAGVGKVANGFIGVDIFFVLSGYLVTGLLLRDLESDGGRIRFGRFYARRARRLLPAASLVLIVTAVVFAAIAAPIEFPAARSGIAASSLYVANWHFIRQAADYFASDVAGNPVLHFWSLSVEEQFYLVWPLLLTGIVWAARRARAHRTRAVQAMIAIAMVGSASWATFLSTTDLDRAYYGTDSRAYQLLAGALLAVAPGAIRRLRTSRGAGALPAACVALLVALAVLATPAINLGPIGRGIVVAAMTVALLAALESSDGRTVSRALGWGPLAYLGKISYGTYLWHWLIIVVLAREADLSHITTAAITVAVATGLASLSYQVLEQPVRTAQVLDRYRPAVIATGLAMSVLVALVIAPRILDPDRVVVRTTAPANAATVGAGAPSRSAVGDTYFDFFDYGDCEVSGPVACPLGPTPVPGAAEPVKTAIVVGESHAGMLSPMLTDLAERNGVALYAGYLSYCPWTLGLRYGTTAKGCFADQDDLFDRILPELDPDIVFLAHRPVDDPADPVPLLDASDGRIEDPEAKADALDRRITSLVRSLRNDGRTVVMFERVPVV